MGTVRYQRLQPELKIPAQLLNGGATTQNPLSPALLAKLESIPELDDTDAELLSFYEAKAEKLLQRIDVFMRQLAENSDRKNPGYG